MNSSIWMTQREFVKVGAATFSALALSDSLNSSANQNGYGRLFEDTEKKAIATLPDTFEIPLPVILPESCTDMHCNAQDDSPYLEENEVLLQIKYPQGESNPLPPNHKAL
jgi:hypothetical protein